jgi:predicted amidophosphoribosyltransferase/predicted nucleic acid-binding Zn ribbon protein
LDSKVITFSNLKAVKLITKQAVTQWWLVAFVINIVVQIGLPYFYQLWWVSLTATLFTVMAIIITFIYLSQEMPKCPYCQKELEAKSPSCERCGRTILEKCPSCGENLDWGNRFCPNCGANFRQILANASDEAEFHSETETISNLSDSFYCRSCGLAIAANSTFCSGCGDEINPPVKNIPEQTKKQAILGVAGTILFTLIGFPDIISLFGLNNIENLIFKAGIIVGFVWIIKLYRKEEKVLSPAGATLLEVIRVRGWFRLNPPSQTTLKEAWIGGTAGVLLFVVILPYIILGWEQKYAYILGAICLIGPIVTYLVYRNQEKVRCPYCHTILTDTPEMCPACGRKILRQCPQCHQAELEWGIRFCPQCGASMLGFPETENMGEFPESIDKIQRDNPDINFCAKCATQAVGPAKYCFRCGTAIEELPAKLSD